MTTFKHTLLLALFFLFSGQLLATHIVGGGITYECIDSSGNLKRYRFTMKVYRDCLNGQVNFDNPASIAIYQGNFNVNTRIASFTVPLLSVQTISVNEPDCIDNLPNICLEEGTYVWERTLPVINQSYFVEFQRCCRTNAIANIYAPSSTGATYHVEITGVAQTLNNNSPTFNNFPPVVICNNYPLEVDFSATDLDGDQLVYSFCAPYSGGGETGSGCDSPAPSPPCAPPYDEVNFITPNYFATQPMGGNPIIGINAQTGVISGTPRMNGQFVVGVCVQEFRNGQLLSVTRRDFQFNVADCAPQVTALVQYDELESLQHYVIKQCTGSTTVNIINESTSLANIEDFLWTFDLHNGVILQNSTDFNLTVNFPGFGSYEGTLVLNQGLDCGDTAFIRVELHAPASLDLGDDIKLCKDSTIVFDAGTGFVSFQWQDGSTSQTFSATTSGLYYVTAIDSCGNALNDSVKVTITPIPDVELTDVSLCPGTSVTLNVPGFDQYSWSPAVGLSCTDCASVTVQAGTNTTYTLSATNNEGCEAQGSFDVTVLPTPMQTYVIQFYPNESVTLGGQTYTTSDTVVLTVPSTTGGCDSLNTYILELLPTTLTIQCPPNVTVALPNGAGTTVVNYPEPTTTTDCPGTPPTVQLTQGLASGGNFPAGVTTVCYEATNTCGNQASCCFTVTVTTIDIQCPANVTVAIPNNSTTAAVNYAQPTATTNCPGAAPTVQLLSGIASGGSFPIGVTTVCYNATNTCGNAKSCCFTVTGTTLDIQCPPSVTVQLPVAGTTIAVNYAAPTATTNCPGSTPTIQLVQGLASGGGFPLGINKVCYEGTNTCGNRDTCCFNVTVVDAPPPCDIKVIGCMKFELLDIRLDSITQRRFRIRATNFCASELDYVAIQLPPGVVAVTPQEGSTYTAPNTGNKYKVRNPNASPFYSTRYRSVSNGINNSQSDVFEYRLPQQSHTNHYIHIMGKLKNGESFEAHLNTWYCPVQPWAGNKGEVEGRMEDSEFDVERSELSVRPNPTDGVLLVDVNQWPGQTLQVQVLNSQGQLVLNQRHNADNEWLELNLDQRLSNGLYYLVVKPVGGAAATAKFILER